MEALLGVLPPEPVEQLRLAVVGGNALAALVCLVAGLTFGVGTFADAPSNGVNLGTELLFLLPVGLFGYGAFVARNYTSSRRSQLGYFMGAVGLLVMTHLLLVSAFTVGVRPYELAQAEAVIASECVGEEGDMPCYCHCPETCENSHQVDDCSSAPCLHSGECIDGASDYTCDCSHVAPWTGPNCEVNAQEPEATPNCPAFSELVSKVSEPRASGWGWFRCTP